MAFSTSELLDFPIYASNKFDDLKKHPQYFVDLENFKLGLSVRSDGKPYDTILGNIRLFGACLHILLRRYISFINEIDDHKLLYNSQKKLLLKELMDTQVEKYYTGCWMLGYDSELKELAENLYLAFVPNIKADFMLFDNKFYDLKNLIDRREDLKEHTESA